ncbi:MAG: hypothetical protein HN742_33355 [Lentisphaerae bacterium]|jgi:hypothetical protein|nr:hypothetical protein [Lentisphaerota bacterium]MBT4819312.1 hypothetical protein [Lentisphaerota bacterium]MBT5606542.1 hypothetical protein [Lentisphaerota bacterium]MBT7053451.1 hypothetical protein [Lentisphaerota bacterium]MBT7846806.1 hypothetical protein [Lentisphaerota bacterium]
MLALGIPFFWNDNDHRDHLDTNGFANAFIFEKWNVLQETKTLPGVSVDAWYYFASGDSNRMGAGSHSWKFTAEISKAWKKVSVHLNPAYRTGSSGGLHMIEGNAGILYQPCKKLWPAIEYNYFRKESKGSRHDIIPGIIWKFRPGCSFKVGPVFTVDSSESYRDKVGLVMKLFASF